VETSVTTAGKVVEGVVMVFWAGVLVGSLEVVLGVVLELLELLVLEAEEEVEEGVELEADDDDEEDAVVDEVGVIIGGNGSGKFTSVVDDVDVVDVDEVVDGGPVVVVDILLS
jgi:hypothetical protein